MKRIDIVVPAYNEQECLRVFYDAVIEVIRPLPYRFRLLFVDDGSDDDTPRLLGELAEEDPRVGFLRLSRNFGHQAALTAGLDAADADAVITMDADLQHPPSCIPTFIEAWERGAELVSGERKNTEDIGLLKRASSRMFYVLLRRLSDVPIVSNSPDFRLLDAKVLTAVRRIREQGRFLRGIYSWAGFQQVRVAYDQPARVAGTPKYSWRRMFLFALAGVLSHSRFPLRLATYMGLLVSFLAFVYGVYAAAQSVVFHRAVEGWTSLAVLISFLSGIQLLTMGIIGEYLGQVFDETRRRPLYLVSDARLPPWSTHDDVSPG